MTLAIYIENLMGEPEKDSAHWDFLLSASSQSFNQAVQGLADLRRYYKIYKTNPFSYLQKGKTFAQHSALSSGG